MQKLITAAIFALLGWQAYAAYHRSSFAAQESATESWEEEAAEAPDDADTTSATTDSRFTCDGRTYCSEMTSCEEATWFINNCPGTKMDGNNDGEPCETQWCNSK